MLKRIIACFCVLFNLFFLFPLSASATSISDAAGAVSILDWMEGDSNDVSWSKWWDALFSNELEPDPGCPASEDGYHEWTWNNKFTGTLTGSLDVECKCCLLKYRNFLSEQYSKPPEDVTALDAFRDRYSKFNGALPATTYASDASLIWKPTWSDLSNEITSLYTFFSSLSTFKLDSPFAVGAKYSDPKNSKLSYTVEDSRSFGAYFSSESRPKFYSIHFPNLVFSAPVTGLYTVLGEGYPGLSYTGRDGTSVYSDALHYSDSPLFVGKNTTFTVKPPSVSFDKYCTYFLAFYSLPTIRIDPDNSGAGISISEQYYDNSTRVGNYVGSYAVYNSTDNSYNPVSGDTHIVNETDNSVYNPVTNTTTDYSGWTYDYSTRTYTFSNDDNSSTSTVTYGDENITIADTAIDGNGNTVTNNYTVYYYNGTATDTPSPSPSPSPSAGPVGPSTPVSPSGGSRVFQNYPATITQSYGNDGHGGTDCIPTSGAADTVVAHSDGQVVWVQTGQENNQGATGNASYGNAVKLQHANGYYTLYAHLDSVAVTEGQQVTKGQALGVMGNTGNSYGAHLHFEVRDSTDARVNSDPYLYADLPGLSTDSSWWGNAMGSLGNVLGASGLLEVFGSVGSAFSQLWSWLPPEIVTVFLVGVTLLVAAACMKFFL